MGSTAVRSVALRLEVQGDDVVVRKLDQVGKGGEAAMGRMRNSSKEVPGYLRAVNVASNELQGSMTGMAGRAGITGQAIAAMGPVGLGVGAVLGTLAITASKVFSEVEKAEATADALEQSAKRLRMSTNEFQQWQAASRELDVSMEDVASGLTNIKQKTDEYVAGLMRSREARVFQVLGLTREEVAQASTATDRLYLISDALAKIQNKSVREGIAEKLGLGAMLPLLEGGSARLKEFFAEARRNNQVLDESINTPLAEAHKESEKIEKSISNNWARAIYGLAPAMNWMKRQWEGLGKAIADSISGVDGLSREQLKDEASQLERKFGEDVKKAPQNAGPASGRLIAGGFNFFNPQYFTPEDQLIGAQRRYQQVMARLRKMDEPSGSVGTETINGDKPGSGGTPNSHTKLPPTMEEIEAAKRLAEEKKRLAKETADYIDALAVKEAGEAKDQVTAEQQANVARLKGKAGYYAAVTDMINATAEAGIKKIEAETKAEFGKLDELEKKYRDAGLPVPGALEEQRKTIGRIAADKVAAVKGHQAQEAADNAEASKTELQKFIDQINGPFDKAMDTAATHGMQSFSDALLSIAMGADDAASAFKKMAASIISDLARIVIQKTITVPVGNWLSGVISHGGDFPSGLLGSGHAVGGPVSAGVVYPVNERGFELLQTRQDSYVLDHSRSVTNVAAEVAKRMQPSVVVTQSGPNVNINNYGEPITVQRKSYDPKTNTLNLDLRRGLRQEISNSVSDGDLDASLGARFNATPTVKRRM